MTIHSALRFTHVCVPRHLLLFPSCVIKVLQGCDFAGGQSPVDAQGELENEVIPHCSRRFINSCFQARTQRVHLCVGNAGGWTDVLCFFMIYMIIFYVFLFSFSSFFTFVCTSCASRVLHRHVSDERFSKTRQRNLKAFNDEVHHSTLRGPLEKQQLEGFQMMSANKSL